MITREQIEEADFLCKQARESAAIAHACFANLADAYNSLVRSYKAAGFTHDAAVAAFEASMEANGLRLQPRWSTCTAQMISTAS